MRRVLVTGGTGFLGAALTIALVQRGDHVRVLDNGFRGRAERLAKVAGDVEVVEGDVRDFAAVEAATRGVDWVFHLASINGTRHFYERPDLVLEVGIKGALHTMDAARRHGVARYVLASSSEVYQEPTRVPTDEGERLVVPDITNPRFSYSGGKIVSELLALHYLRRAGVESVIFRPHNVYGPDMGVEHVIPEFARRMRSLAGRPGAASVEFPIQGSGRETRAFCYVDDAVKGILIAAEQGRGGEIYHIGTEEEVTIADLARRIGRRFGLDVTPLAGPARPGGTPRRCPDIGKIRALGYEPRVSLDEGLRLTCDWYRACPD